MGKSFDLCAIYDIITKNPHIDSAKRSYYLDRLLNIAFEYQRHIKPNGVKNGNTIIYSPVTNYGINNAPMIGVLNVEENSIDNGEKINLTKRLFNEYTELKVSPEKGMWMNPFFFNSKRGILTRKYLCCNKRRDNDRKNGWHARNIL